MGSRRKNGPSTRAQDERFCWLEHSKQRRRRGFLGFLLEVAFGLGLAVGAEADLDAEAGGVVGAEAG